MADGVGLSIIIPMYNVESYLDNCITSLLRAEGIEKVQIILVDDGSTDSTGKMADDYSHDHCNISVIHTPNKGPSEARNIGINESCGKYLFFCDADDEVVPELFSDVIRISVDANVDIVLWDAELFDDYGSEFTKKRRDYFVHRGLYQEDGIITGEQALKQQIDACMNFPATVWLGIYNRNFILENNLFFEKGILHEDELWVSKVVLCAKTVKYFQNKVYRYRIHKGSITNPDSEDWTRHIESLLYIYPELYRYCDERYRRDAFCRKIESCFTRRYLHMIYYYDFYKYGYKDRIDLKQLWQTSGRIIDKIRVIWLWIRGMVY